MKRPTHRSRSARWISLMYATSALLIVCGIPATVLLSLMLLLKNPAHLNRRDILLGTLYMTTTVALIAVTLHWVARMLEKRAEKNLIEE